MPTYIVYSDPSDGEIVTNNATYAASVAGTNAAANTGATAGVGQLLSGGFYNVWEAFLGFDTSAVVGTIASAKLEIVDSGDDSVQDFTIQCRIYDWGVAITTADWLTVANITTKTLVATYNTASGWLGATYKLFTDVALAANINQSGFTRLFFNSDRHVAGNVPVNAVGEDVVFECTDSIIGALSDPKLTIVVSGGINPVQLVGQNSATTTGTTLVVTVPAGGCALNNKLLVGFVNNSAGADAAATCADSKGNTYTLEVDRQLATNGNKRLHAFSCNITTALVSGDTITVTSPSLSRRVMDVREFSGLTTGTIDKMAVADSNGTPTMNPNSGVTATRSVADELLYGVGCWIDTIADVDVRPGAGYVDPIVTIAGLGTTWLHLMTEWDVVSVVGTDSADANFGANHGWIWAVLTFPGASAVSATLGGSAIAGITESDVVAGGKVLTITLAGDTWLAN